MTTIRVTATIEIGEDEILETFIQSAGPGGQNVNKVASAVQLRFDIAQSKSLPEDVRARLRRIAGNKVTKDGILVLTARRFRAQERNREDARDRLIALIRAAAAITRPRKPTRMPTSARKRRADAKKRHSALKQLRSRPEAD